MKSFRTTISLDACDVATALSYFRKSGVHVKTRSHLIELITKTLIDSLVAGRHVTRITDTAIAETELKKISISCEGQLTMQLVDDVKEGLKAVSKAAPLTEEEKRLADILKEE